MKTRGKRFGIIPATRRRPRSGWPQRPKGIKRLVNPTIYRILMGLALAGLFVGGFVGLHWLLWAAST